uniref:barstar family protein n=1 Tax=Burkholderia anthina TaxID=179879 RepID=UPI001ABAFC8F
MTSVYADTTEITDWPSFHRIFSNTFCFPAFYGNNMDTLIDCLSYVDEPEAKRTGVHVRPGGTLSMQLGCCQQFQEGLSRSVRGFARRVRLCELASYAQARSRFGRTVVL